MEVVDVKTSRCKMLVEDLPQKVFKDISMRLNPNMVCGGDWRTVAGMFGMSMIEIMNLEKEKDPTLEILKDWWACAGDKTVSRLIEIMEEIKRADVVKILEPFEYVEISKIQSQPSGEETMEDSSKSEAVSTSRPSKLPLVTGFTNGTVKQHSDPDDLNSIGAVSNKSQPIEHLLDEKAFAFAGDTTLDPDSQDELDETGGMYHGRGSRTNRKKAAASVQTQIPSPTVASEAPSFPSPAAQQMNGNIENIRNLGPLTAPTDKIALVIGNLHYKKKQFNKLSYTVNDAFDIAAALTEQHFKVISMVDLTLTEMRTIMLAFCRLLGPGIYAVIYYAGHGFELDGENYLLPVDAMSPDPNESIRAQEFLQEMQNCDTLLNLMFLDCCRTRSKDNRAPLCSLKRNTRGNTVIAYSCCTQHQAYEQPNGKNGVYARHLLRHINRDVRIETLLMDVSADVVASRSVDQRPTFESDAYLECRLTAHIIHEDDVAKARERYTLWHEGNKLPENMTTEIGQALLHLSFQRCFSNLLQINLDVTNHGQRTMNNCRFSVDIAGPVTAETAVVPRQIEPSNQTVPLGTVRISKLQKLCNESIFIVIDFESDEEQHIKKLSLGKPLISGITGSFHEWITERNYEPVAKSSWI